MKALGVLKKRSQDYRQGYEDGRRAGVEAAVRVLMFGVVQYLGDKRGWKRESVFAALQWIYKYADMQVDDLTTFAEVEAAVREEYGIVYDNGKFYLLE